MRSKIMLFRNVLLLLGVFFAVYSSGQSNTVAAGGDAASGSGSIAYSIGQVFFESNTDGVFSSSEGLQQPFEISGVVSVKGNVLEFSAIEAFPNPVKNRLYFRDTQNKSNKIGIRIFDMQGKTLVNNPSIDINKNLSVEGWTSGTYLLEVKSENGQVEMIKVIKE